MRPQCLFASLALRSPRARRVAFSSPRLPSRRLRAACGLLTIGAISVGLVSPVRADVRWKLNQNGLWNIAANWNTNTLPGSADDVFNDFASATITFNTNATINSFLSQGAFILSSGTLTGSQTNSASTFQVNNVFTFNSGSLSNFTVNQGAGGSVVFTNSSGNSISNVIFNSAINMSNGFAQVYGSD